METLQRTANRGSISTGYDVDNSLKIESDNSESLNRTLGTPTNVDKATFSFWFKRTEQGRQWLFSTRQNTSSPYDTFRISMTADDEIQVQNYQSSYNARIVTNRVFRDTNAWYHIVASIDTTQSTAGDRIRLYVNGVEETSFSTEDQPPQDSDLYLESGRILEIGRFIPDQGLAGALYECEGYLAEAHFVDGQQLAPTEFGEFDEDSNIWKPKAYSGTYGNNGHYLKFASSGSLGTDSSGNGNDFTLNNIAAADQATDSPTNNFCTFNVLVQTDNKPTINEGAMHVAGGGGNWNNAYGSLGVQNGKWYYEYKVTNTEFGFFGASTFPDTSDDATSTQFMFDQSFTIGYAAAHYYQRINGSQISNESTGWGTTSVNDIYSLFLNVDDQEFTVARNGSVLSGTLSQPVSFNSAFSGHFVFPCNAQYEDDGGEFNFGGYTLISNTKSYNDANGYGNFVYSPVLSGVNYYAICTKNIAEFG
jgi:hypothetical protein